MSEDVALGDNVPTGDFVLNLTTTTHVVTVTTTGPADTDLELSLFGPASCDPHWTSPLDPHPTTIADSQLSLASVANMGAGVLTAQYSISCPSPGAYTLQVVANVTSESMPIGQDPSPSDNQDQDIVLMLVADGDLCPGLAEDEDGVQDSDGCPDSDAGVTIVKEEQLTIQEDVPSTHAMTITVTNGNYPADVHLTLLAVSHLGICEVRLLPLGGDNYTEFVTDEDNNGVQETLFSEIHRDLVGMAAGQSIVLVRSYSLVCSTAGPFVDPFEIQADVLPMLPVREESLGNPALCPAPWCVPPVAGGPPSASDNVHKNFPDVLVNTATPSGCPLAPPDWQVPAGDGDCDGFRDFVGGTNRAPEVYIGTNNTQYCAATGEPNDEPGPDAMPPDFNDDQIINGQDAGKFGGPFGSYNKLVSQGPFGPPGSELPGERFDFSGDGLISGQDTGKFQAYYDKTCA